MEKVKSEVRMATEKQKWALFCITGEDWKDREITFEEASRIIGEYKKKKEEERKEIIRIFLEAIKEGEEEEKKVKEGPTVIYEADLQDRPIEGGKKYFLKEFSGCGWVYLYIFKESAKRLKKVFFRKKGEKGIYILKAGKHIIELRKANIGWLLTIDGRDYSNGHIMKLYEYYRGIARVLGKYGIECSIWDRLD